MSDEAKANFVVPNWAGKPSSGLHLDVMKEGKLIQKLMIDEKKCYFFGRNKQLCDFTVDHASCSRVHAVLLWHKHLARSFLIDLGSAHGTFIGNYRLEHNKPQQLFIDSEIKFGASTRSYVIRERPPQNSKNLSTLIQSEDKNDNEENNAYGLPQSEAELDNLTEFNTAHNTRIAQIVDISSEPGNLNLMLTVKKKRKCVSFNEEEQVINPEDIDPSVGRFRNLVHSTFVIPNKKRSSQDLNKPFDASKEDQHGEAKKKLKRDYSDDEDDKSYEDRLNNIQKMHSFDVASKLGIKMPDLAPDVAHQQKFHAISISVSDDEHNLIDDDEAGIQRKKKYAKEAWPGRKATTTSSASTAAPTSASNSYSLY